MVSEYLKRKYKKMYKNDVAVLQLALCRIFPSREQAFTLGHLCKDTEWAVKTYQGSKGLGCDGIVTPSLWTALMSKYPL